MTVDIAQPARVECVDDLEHAVTALDLFAGTGWGVACRALGIDEVGVELMPEAVATREANGMTTLYHDVWEGLEGRHAVPDYDLLIASPPCQTFSMAGKGAGRAALDEVIGLIDSRAYLDVAALRAFGELHDPRTALVLTPLAHIVRDVPLYVVLEQVPTVLPVWEKYAEVMRRWGYSVVTGILSAEQYGVPQTRKRAILIARADGVEARMPEPTHSSYYPRNPSKLDEGVEPWVSMAEALGWGMTERPYMTVSSGTDAGGGTDPAALGGSGARRTVLGEREAGRWTEGMPARTVTANGLVAAPGVSQHDAERSTPRSTRPEADRAAFIGNQYPDPKSKVPGKAKERQRREVDRPAPTLTAGSRSAQWETAEPGDLVVRTSMGEPKSDGRNGTHQLDPVERPAHTVTTKVGDWRVNDQSGTERDAAWPEKRPATTLATRDLVADPGHNVNRHDAAHVTKSRNDGIRVTIEEAAALQSYPPGFVWVGSKTSTFRQIGNAVPPLLGWHVLRAALEGA